MPDLIAYLPWDRYLESIRADSDRLLAVGTDLDVEVPSCPGWTVADLLEHVAMVYLHKVACMQVGAAPDPWPPADLDTSDPAALLRQAEGDLLTELRTRGPHEERHTWFEPDQTNGFWYRRMALEVAVHRVDGELAVGAVTPVPDDIAVDGIDEILRIMLPEIVDDEDHRTAHPVDARVRVTAGGRSWTATVAADAVDVDRDVAGDVEAEVAGGASEVFLWLWGRHPMDDLAVTGDHDVAVELRARLAEDA